jgi:hypothetical protein
MIKFENKSNGRFYYLSVKKDMLNDDILHINYGGLSASRYRTICFASLCNMQKEIARISKIRLQRGYSLVT